MIKTQITNLIRARIRLLEAQADSARKVSIPEYERIRSRIEGLHDALDIVIWEKRDSQERPG
jgi:hypothetical protein